MSMVRLIKVPVAFSIPDIHAVQCDPRQRYVRRHQRTCWCDGEARPHSGFRDSATHDATVGFDMDGYLISGPRHVASLKGVIADEVRFEHGFTKATMSV